MNRKPSPPRAFPTRPPASWPLRLAIAVCAGTTAGWALLVADSVAREGWAQVRFASHIDAAFVLHTGYGALVGLGAAVATLFEGAAAGALGHRWPRGRIALHAATWAALAVGASWATAFHLFEAQRVAATASGRWGPWVLLGLAAAAGASVSVARSWHGTRARVFFSLLAVGAAVALMRIDLTVLVALYAQAHAALEVTATLLWVVGVMGLAHVLVRRWPSIRFVVGTSAGVSVAILLLSFTQATRERLLQQLRHTWREPVYAGRLLARLDRYDAWPNGHERQGDDASRGLRRLVDQYDIVSTSRSPKWDSHARPGEEPRAQVDALRKRLGGSNIIVFYVDSLRFDAVDSAVMPNAAKFAAEGIDFRRAYSPASDTAMVLPCLLRGNYDLPGKAGSDVLSVAQRTGTKRVLAIPRSAREFLAKSVPEFSFDEDLVVPDYRPGEQVWGYGARQPSADALTDSAVAWLRGRGPERFLLWLFHFDVHNWNYLDRAYLEERTNALSIPDEGKLPWRYRVAVAGVDAAFGRFLAALDELGMRDDTVVVFMSDHGEALGEYRFWMHSTYLWEPLVRVPLALRIPGTSARRVDGMVSLVDFAPTLAAALEPGREMRGYHGEDLLGHLTDSRPPRRFPLLMRASTKDTVTRLGVIDPELPYKLVVPLDSGIPQLYDLRAPIPEDAEHAAERPAETAQLLSTLVRSPVFPRVELPRRSGRPQR